MEFAAHIRENEVQTCTEHCRNTAEVAGKALASVRLKNVAYLSGLLHDMGKFHPKFDNYIRRVASGEKYTEDKVNHTFTGVSFVLNRYHNGDLIRKITAEIIALAIGSHHGLFDIYHETDNKNAFCHRIKEQPAYDKVAVFNFMKECAPQEELDYLFEQSVEEIRKFEFEKVKPLWTEPETRTKYDFYLGLLARLVLSAVVEGDRRDASDFMNNRSRDYVSKVDWYDEAYSLNTITTNLKKIVDACRDFAKEPSDIYYLQNGEILSSFTYALCHAQMHGKRRIFYVAPYISILEKNTEIMKKALPDMLLHYSNIVAEKHDGSLLDERELLQESWESKIVATSLTQMLQTMFSGKMSSVRRFNSLSNSVIVFDEIQNLPTKIYSMFNLVVNFLVKCCNSTVILCSPVLPAFNQGDYKMLVSDKQVIPQSLLSSEIKMKKWPRKLKIEEVPDIAVKHLPNNVLVVCNTKKEAKAVFSGLQNKLNGVDLYYLSAAMCPAHRKDVLKELTKSLSEDKKVICVSTQTIEAGTDISFDSVLRFAAGLDDVIQCAKLSKNDVQVLEVYGENLRLLKEIQDEKSATISLFDFFESQPENFSYELAPINIVNYYYEKLSERISKNLPNYPKEHTTLLDLLATNSYVADNAVEGRNRSEYSFAQSFKTAGDLFEVYDNNQVSVLVPYNDEAKMLIASLWADPSAFYKEDILAKAKDYIVPVYNIEELKNLGAVELSPKLEIPCLLEGFYNAQGISKKKGNVLIA
jgi:CRISPR-associated endonuclease/helicase Cas3